MRRAGLALCAALATTPLSVAFPQSPAQQQQPHQQAEAQLARRQYVVDDWVSIDRDGNVLTITPTATTEAGGAVRTLSPPPYQLTGSVFTVTNTDGVLSTSTGRPPPPQATDKTGTGSFARCHGKIGVDEPFCEPRRGSDLYQGNTYYVTWDPDYFGLNNIFVLISAWSIDPSSGESLKGGAEFMGARVPATRGYYTWTVDPRDLNGQPRNNISLHLSFYDPRINQNKDIIGPAVVVHTPLPTVAPASSGGSPNLLGVFIAVPIVVVALIGAGIGWWFWRRRRAARTGGGAIAAVKRASSGYGSRKSYAERMSKGDEGTVGIQLSDSPTSPTTPGGRNLFQEEVRRQDLERERM